MSAAVMKHFSAETELQRVSQLTCRLEALKLNLIFHWPTHPVFAHVIKSLAD